MMRSPHDSWVFAIAAVIAILCGTFLLAPIGAGFDLHLPALW